MFQTSAVLAVQFIHPGHEHVIGKRDAKKGVELYDWNAGRHKRKFMTTQGKYVDSEGVLQCGNIYFWGEWEPWSKVHLLSTVSTKGDYPLCLHEPVFYQKSKCPYGFNRKGVNTDPFVFGDNFLYSLCQQNRKTGQTKMTTLSLGSLILFGACKNPRTKDSYFALDTVFVVSDRKCFTQHSYRTDLQDYIPPYYNKIMRFGKDKAKTYVAYKGASFSSQINGMYSFTPCKIGFDGANGFERPKLTSENINLITNNLTQGFKATSSDIQTNYAIWKKVRDVIRSQGFYEGVQMDYTIL